MTEAVKMVSWHQVASKIVKTFDETTSKAELIPKNVGVRFEYNSGQHDHHDCSYVFVDSACSF